MSGWCGVNRRGEEILEAIVGKHSLVLRKIGGGRAGEVASGRFLDNGDVTPQSIIVTAAERTLGAARGRRVLAIQDTAEVNFSGRAARRTGLGPAGDGVSPGFFCSPCCWSMSSMKPYWGYGDKGYASDAKKRAAEKAGVLWAVKAKPGRELTKRQRARNRRFGKVRAKVEHVFRVLKCQLGYRKVRYRGIAKNGA